MDNSNKHKIGDSVIVNNNVKDPDFGFDISGWQGRVIDVDDYNSPVISWDSITLEGMGLDLISKCENDNLNWKVMILDGHEVMKTEPRDTEEAVKKVIKSIELKLLSD